MPYTIENPPDAIKSLPKHAQEIFIAAYNAAYAQYKGDESRTNATAWAAVKTKYEKVKDAWKLKEANMDLKEAIKTEDGVEYPAEAYAYVPDKKDPSTWRLRLWEGDRVTPKRLKTVAAFLSPGGFHGQLVNILESELSEVKRKIRAEYSKLNVDTEDMPRWVKESTTRELVSDYIPLTEAKYDKGTALLTIIRPGFNASKGRFYPKEMLARDYGIFEGVKMYADHPTEADEKNRPERSIKDWVASLTNVRVNEKGEVEGRATVIEPWMQEKLAMLQDKGMLSEMGVSINAVGSASNAEIEGVKTNLVEKLIRARSVDFVTEAGAGGTVNLYESVENDIDLIDLVSLKERRPDLVKSIESGIRSEIHTEVKKKMELEAKVTELEGQIATLTTERDAFKAQIEEANKAKAKAETQAKVKETVEKTDLPEIAKARLIERFVESADGLDEAIKAETEYILKLAEAGKVKGMGPTKTETDQTALKESWKKMHPEYTDAQLEVVMKGR